MNQFAPGKPSPPSHLRPSQYPDLLLWMLRRRRRFRVVGHSMEPLLKPQEEVLINPSAYSRFPPAPGDLVVTRHPLRPEMRLIKWVVSVDGNSCFLQGLNLAASTDSRDFGRVPHDQMLGKVVCRFP